MLLKDRSSTNIIITCFISGCLEIYDFTIFGILANQLEQNYFSFVSNGSNLFITYSLFAIGFIFRPLGSIMFGYIGDRFGRKKSLILSMYLMGVSTLGIAILPNYEKIGVLSCYLLVFFRIIQGISVGGEYIGSVIFAIEHFNFRYKGLIGSIVLSGCMLGIILSALVGKVITNQVLPEYAWRFAFIIGFIISLLGFKIRKSFIETPKFRKINTSRHFNIFKVVRVQLYPCVATALIAAACSSNLYLVSVYIPNSIKSNNLSWISILSVTCMCVMIPLFGYISDRINANKMIVTSSIFLAIISILIKLLLLNNIIYDIVVMLCYSIAYSMYAGAMNGFIISLFPTKVRYICTALSYSVGASMFGGTTPMSLAFISNLYGSYIFVSIYMSAVSFLGIVAIYILTITNRNTKLTTFNKEFSDN